MYTIAQLGFIALTVLFFYLLLKTFASALAKSSFSAERQKHVIRTLVITLLLWAILVSALSLLGVTGNFEIFPFNIAPLLVIPFISILVFTFSGTMREILANLHPSQLIRLQVFRVFVEILLWMLFIQHLLPVQMSFEGRNFDILSGLTAPLVAWLSNQNKLPKAILIIWNLVCLGLLINIVSIAILSMPVPFRYFTNEPSNTIVTVFPFIWLPTFLVPLAYLLHFFSLRQLFMKSSKSV